MKVNIRKLKHQKFTKYAIFRFRTMWSQLRLSDIFARFLGSEMYPLVKSKPVMKRVGLERKG